MKTLLCLRKKSGFLLSIKQMDKGSLKKMHKVSKVIKTPKMYNT